MNIHVINIYWRKLLFLFLLDILSQFISVLGYGLDDRGSRIRFPVGAGNFSLHHRVQNGSGAHPASCPMATRVSLRVKRPGREVNHSPPSSDEVKENVELYLHFPNKPSRKCAQLKKKHSDNFIFTFTVKYHIIHCFIIVFRWHNLFWVIQFLVFSPFLYSVQYTHTHTRTHIFCQIRHILYMLSFDTFYNQGSSFKGLWNKTW
jgi:hypothetical protein